MIAPEPLPRGADVIGTHGVVGVDVGTRKVSIAYGEVKPDGTFTLVEGTSHVSPLAAPRHQQLRDIADFVFSCVLDYGPSVVMIEESLIGNNRKYSIQLSQVVGAVLASLNEYVLSTGCVVDLVNVSTWKKVITGNGNANKEHVTQWLKSSQPGYSALSVNQDERDAGCIASYGARLLQSERPKAP